MARHQRLEGINASVDVEFFFNPLLHNRPPQPLVTKLVRPCGSLALRAAVGHLEPLSFELRQSVIFATSPLSCVAALITEVIAAPAPRSLKDSLLPVLAFLAVAVSAFSSDRLSQVQADSSPASRPVVAL